MRISLSGLQSSPRNSGIGRYLESLYRRLVPLLVERDGHAVTLYLSQDSLFAVGGCEVRRIPFRKHQAGLRTAYEHTVLPARLRGDRTDVYFAPDGKLPLWMPRTTRGVVVVHDLSPFRLASEAHRGTRVAYWRLVFARSFRRASRVVVDSDFTGQELACFADVDPSKLVTVYLGVDEAFRPIDDAGLLEQVARKHDLPARYVLFVGQFSPRKNLPLLFEALGRYNRSASEPLPLVVVGERGWKDASDLALVSRLGITELVRFPGHVPDADLPAVYSLATCLAYPSIYEGFGLPPLEAMACGTPVICSDASSLPEVVGDAAVMVDPRDAAGWARAIGQVVSDATLSDSLRRAGLARASRFTWEAAAEKVASVIATVGAADGRPAEGVSAAAHGRDGSAGRGRAKGV